MKIPCKLRENFESLNVACFTLAAQSIKLRGNDLWKCFMRLRVYIWNVSNVKSRGEFFPKAVRRRKDERGCARARAIPKFAKLFSRRKMRTRLYEARQRWNSLTNSRRQVLSRVISALLRSHTSRRIVTASLLQGEEKTWLCGIVKRARVLIAMQGAKWLLVFWEYHHLVGDFMRGLTSAKDY